MTSLLRMPPGVKPNYPVEIDWDHPLAKGLKVCIPVMVLNYASVVDLVSSKRLVVEGTVDSGITELAAGNNSGPTLKGLNSTTNYLKFNHGIDVTDECSACFNFAAPVFQTTNSDAIVSLFGQSTTANGATVFAAEDNAVSVGYNGHRTITPKSTLAIDTYYSVGYVSPGTTSGAAKVYIDGEEQTLTDEGGGSVTLATGAGTTAEFAMDPFNQNSATNLSYFYMWTRQLSDSEIHSIARDPYQFLQPAGHSARPIITTAPTYSTGLRVPDPKWEAPSILVPRVKPTGPVEIDWEAPLAKGLVGCWVGGSTENLVTGDVAVIVGDEFEAVPGLSGLGWQASGTNTSDRLDLGSVNSSNPLSLAGKSKASMFCLFTWGGPALTNDFPRFFDKSDGGTALNGWAFYPQQSVGRFHLAVDGDVAVSGAGYDEPSVPELATLGISSNLTAGISYDAEIFLNGDSIEQSNSITSTSFPSNTTNAAIGNWNHSTGRECSWPIHLMLIYSDRVLTTAEQQSLSRDPYQFLIPA